MVENKLYNTADEQERVVLIGIDSGGDFGIDSCLDELEELAETAGARVVGRMVQKRGAIHSGHYFGKGKLEELKVYADELGATGIICDDELSAAQTRNMENVLNIKIMNRTLLILDIFALRAGSAEGKLQVELAQLKYSLSHLSGQGKSLSRLGGGIGTRGPGEKKLETDRRNIADRISELNRELSEIERHRSVMRGKREKNNMPVAALTGYTNAGKSTLMNAATNAGVLAENKLFATLDTTTRRVEQESGAKFLLTDTVGFIQKLPHNLIQAFRATLEELNYADVIIHVVDASNPVRQEQMQVVYDTFRQLGCMDKPIITVFNKIDRDVERPLPVDSYAQEVLSVSAKTGYNVSSMLDCVENILSRQNRAIKVLIPFSMAAVINTVYEGSEVKLREDRETGTYMELSADEQMQKRLEKFILEE